LIHGVASSWRDWLPILAELERVFDVVVLGLPGHVDTAPFPPGVRPTVTALVDAVAESLDQLEMPTAHLVGSSLGGSIALQLARRGRARTVAALAPAGLLTRGEALAFERSVVRAHRLARTVRPLAPLLRRSRAAARRLLAGAVRDPAAIDPAEAVHKLVAFAGCPTFRELVSDLCARPAEGLESIACPVLILWGERDRRLSIALADRFAATIPGSRLVRLPEAGHLPMWDEPATVARLLVAFASGAAVGSSAS
jgi:pimeloyl-ACP methyl ester carboxylesterase